MKKHHQLKLAIWVDSFNSHVPTRGQIFLPPPIQGLLTAATGPHCQWGPVVFVTLHPISHIVALFPIPYISLLCIKYKCFKLKNSWGYHYNLNYLLSSVASQDTTTCHNATTYIQKVRAHIVSLRHGNTDTDKLCIYFPFFESFLIESCTKQSGKSCTCYTT